MRLPCLTTVAYFPNYHRQESTFLESPTFPKADFKIFWPWPIVKNTFYKVIQILILVTSAKPFLATCVAHTTGPRDWALRSHSAGSCRQRWDGAASWERRSHEVQRSLRRVCADLRRPPQRVANGDTGHPGEFAFQMNRIIFNTNLSRTTLALTNVNTLIYLMFKLGCACW